MCEVLQYDLCSLYYSYYDPETVAKAESETYYFMVPLGART
jgi:hypothetical protein